MDSFFFVLDSADEYYRNRKFFYDGAGNEFEFIQYSSLDVDERNFYEDKNSPQNIKVKKISAIVPKI